jgi:hypothetical protein
MSSCRYSILGVERYPSKGNRFRVTWKAGEHLQHPLPGHAGRFHPGIRYGSGKVANIGLKGRAFVNDVFADLMRNPVSRRAFLARLSGVGLGAAAMAMLAGCGGGNGDRPAPGLVNPGDQPPPPPGGLTDFDILNFALNLEYLEAEFYSFATTGAGIPALESAGVGTPGETTGGRRVSFSDARLAAVATEIAADELAHVRFLRSALGAQAIAKPAINLNALGLGFANESEFLILARAFEDVGVSAYGGAARFISNKDILEAAARILAIEAYHAGNIRLQVVAKGISAPPVDAIDQPPAPNNFFPTDENALALVRSAAQVGAIVRGSDPQGGAFFPAGLNGSIR